MINYDKFIRFAKSYFIRNLNFCIRDNSFKKADPLKRAIPLDKSFVPSGLVVTDENENNFHNFVDPNFKPMIKDFVFDYFNSFNESAILDGYNYIIDSVYRSFEYLQAIWDYNVSKMGLEKTRARVAPTGCSEHQSGLTIE